MLIRPATEDDLPVLLALGVLMHRDSTYRSIPYNGAKLEATLRTLMEDDDGYVRVASDQPDTAPAAFLFGACFPAWFGDGLIASDMALYVPPPLRAQGLASSLLADFTRWATARGAGYIAIGNSAGADDRAFQALGARNGYAPVGSIMIHLPAGGGRADVQS